MILVETDKECPRCGGGPLKLVYTRDSKSAFLNCRTCRANGPSVSVDSIIEDHCLSAWEADIKVKRA